MTDTSSTTSSAPKPESWLQQAWDALTEAEQWLVSDLHEIGYVFTHDVWPAISSALGLLFSQLGLAALNAISATIADPALIPSAVGSALLLTVSTTGVADAKTALANAETAIQNDPTVQGILNPAPQTPSAP